MLDLGERELLAEIEYILILVVCFIKTVQIVVFFIIYGPFMFMSFFLQFNTF